VPLNSSSDIYSQGLTPPPEVPPRSFLYHLEPVGIGTPYTESLSGFIARLAQEHFFAPSVLMKRVAIPYSEGQYTIYLNGELTNAAPAINALGVTASGLVGLLERATLRKDLRFTTMLTWADALPTKKLIRPLRAWCPFCYEEWAGNDQIVYEPLIWSLAPIKACIKHGLPLTERCHHCGRLNHHLDNGSKPGHCSQCKRWLGTPPEKSPLDPIVRDADMEYQSWVIDAVGELISSAPSLPSVPQRANVAITVSKLIDVGFYGRTSEFARLVKMDSVTVRQWLNGRQLPKLETLLTICRQLGIRPKELLCHETPNTLNFTNKYKPLPEDHTRPIGIRWVNWGMAEIQLNAALEENPPPSFTRISKRIGCSCNSIRNRFPELSAKISSRFLEYNNWSFDPIKVKKVLEAALEETLPPSITEIIRRLGGRRSHRKLRKEFPAEYSKIVTKYSADRKKPFDLEGTRAKLLAALKEGPPRSLNQVAKSIGILQSQLHEKLADLCKAISARYRTFSMEETAKRRKLVEEEIFWVGTKLHSKGIYPSRNRVFRLLTVTTNTHTMRDVHRKLKIHLGLD
jgi:DNA-binding Lrp family transcriptional regulator